MLLGLSSHIRARFADTRLTLFCPSSRIFARYLDFFFLELRFPRIFWTIVVFLLDDFNFIRRLNNFFSYQVFLSRRV